MIEKRKFERIEAELPIYCRIVHGKKKLPISNIIETSTQNISRGGLLINWPWGWQCDKCFHCLAWLFNRDCRLKEEPYKETTRVLSPTKSLKLEVKIPISKKPIKTFAEVIWFQEPKSFKQDTYNLGVAFSKPLKSKIFP